VSGRWVSVGNKTGRLRLGMSAEIAAAATHNFVTPPAIAKTTRNAARETVKTIILWRI